MVKQDKNNDILDLLLGTQVDLGEIMTPDTELFPMARFTDSDTGVDALSWERPELQVEYSPEVETYSPEVEEYAVIPEISFLGNDIEIASTVAIESEGKRYMNINI